VPTVLCECPYTSLISEPTALSAADAAWVAKLRDWLIDEGARSRSVGAIWQRFCDTLFAKGVPIARAATQIRAMHSITAGVQRLWTPGHMVRQRDWVYSNDQTAYLRSPVRTVHETKRWLRSRLTAETAAEYEILQELFDEGMTDYVCIPLEFTNGTPNIVSYATRHADGFSNRDIVIMAMLLPTLRTVLELMTYHRMIEDVTRTYLGRAPGRRVVNGDVHRGEVSSMDAAILISDMRDFTMMSDLAVDRDTVRMLNAYYDCVIPAVEQAGGEVLKFMGDGILAVFEDSEESIGFGQGCNTALRAARRALGGVDRYKSANRDSNHAMRIGIALHYGSVAHGNVGSGERLDFTVIGKDVNLASRIASKCKDLDRPLLMLAPFADRVRSAVHELGAFELRGVTEWQTLYGVE
jgi:adenylate cyclase